MQRARNLETRVVSTNTNLSLSVRVILVLVLAGSMLACCGASTSGCAIGGAVCAIRSYCDRSQMMPISMIMPRDDAHLEQRERSSRTSSIVMPVRPSSTVTVRAALETGLEGYGHFRLDWRDACAAELDGHRPCDVVLVDEVKAKRVTRCVMLDLLLKVEIVCDLLSLPTRVKTCVRT